MLYIALEVSGYIKKLLKLAEAYATTWKTIEMTFYVLYLS